jgi:hypothetical protein
MTVIFVNNLVVKRMAKQEQLVGSSVAMTHYHDHHQSKNGNYFVCNGESDMASGQYADPFFLFNFLSFEYFSFSFFIFRDVKKTVFVSRILSSKRYREMSLIYVNRKAALGGNGKSWKTAFKDLQSALDVSNMHPGSTIWITEGTYKPKKINDPFGVYGGKPSFLSFADVTIYGGFEGHEHDLCQRTGCAKTILDGDIHGNDQSPIDRMSGNVPIIDFNNVDLMLGFSFTNEYQNRKKDNSRHVLVVSNSNIHLDSIVIQNGYAGLLDDTIIPTLTWGAGILYIGNDGKEHDVKLNHVDFYACEAYGSDTLIPFLLGNVGRGAAFYAIPGSKLNVNIDDVSIEYGFAWLVSAGFYTTANVKANNFRYLNNITYTCNNLFGRELSVENSLIQNNFSLIGCGGIRYTPVFPLTESPKIVGTTFENNVGGDCTSISVTDVGIGFSQPKLLIENNLFKNNRVFSSAPYHVFAGAICNEGFSAKIVKNKFVGNFGTDSGAIAAYAFSDLKYKLTIKKNNFTNNQLILANTYGTLYSSTIGGGAISVFDESNSYDLKILSNCFKGNRSDVNGGAIALTTVNNGIIRKNVFYNNFAVQRGSAIYLFVSTTNDVAKDNSFTPSNSNTIVSLVTPIDTTAETTNKIIKKNDVKVNNNEKKFNIRSFLNNSIKNNTLVL